MTDRTYLVAEIRAALEARGQQWRTNEDAFQITGRVAWALRREGALLVQKVAPMNGADYQGVRYSHDALAFPGVGWFDILADAGPPNNGNRPVWQDTGVDTRPGVQLVAPFDLDASTGPPPIVVVPPAVDPPVVVLPLPPGASAPVTAEHLDAIARAMADLATEIREVGQTLGLIDDTQPSVLERIDSLEGRLKALTKRLEEQGVVGRIGTGFVSTTVALKLPPAPKP